MISTPTYPGGQFYFDRNAFIINEEPMIFHCHHYNVFLQQTLEDSNHYLDTNKIMINAAHEIAHSQFSKFFQEHVLSVEERKEAVAHHYKACGFGLIDLSGVENSGGKVRTQQNHYATGWLSKFGRRSPSMGCASFFTTGFLTGTIEAIFELELGTLKGSQTQCMTLGDLYSEFVIEKREGLETLEPSPGEGAFENFSFDYHEGENHSNISYKAIVEALTSMEIVGAENGLIDAFGVLLTRHYANYYCHISYRFLIEMEKKFGMDGVNIAKDLLVEAGHVCAFNTFGGVMLSAEWNAMIKPMIKNREDWVHGIVACANAFGWGKWTITELIPNEKLTIKIESGYESNHYLSVHKKSTIPISFLATGGVAGIMNLIYNGDITQTPTLDEAYYEKIFKSDNKFVCEQTKCRGKGDQYDEFVATKI